MFQSIRQCTSIKDLIGQLKLWSLLVFPGFGFMAGCVLRWVINLFLGKHHPAAIEMWLTHIFTMSFLIGLLNNLVFLDKPLEDPKEKAFFICFVYLGLIGVILGLTP